MAFVIVAYFNNSTTGVIYSSTNRYYTFMLKLILLLERGKIQALKLYSVYFYIYWRHDYLSQQSE